MASSWGSSWGAAWGNSWGPITSDATATIGAATSGSHGAGPDAQLSLADYLRRFGVATPEATPEATVANAVATPPNAAPQRTAALRRRQRMEEEILALTDYF